MSGMYVKDGVVFDNCLILAPDGIPTGRCEEKKVRWYLSKGLARQVATDPLTIQLEFEPAGRSGLEWSTAVKPNLCVVCGTTKKLNRHHVIPWSFFRHFPESLKRHNSYDVLPMCINCHTKYEVSSEERRLSLANAYGVPVNGYDLEYHETSHIRGLARTIMVHGHKIPEDRKKQMMSLLQKKLGYCPSQKEMKELAMRLPKKSIGGKTFSELIVEKIKDFNEFAKGWRQHFCDVMSPRFLPEYWSADRKFENWRD